MKSGLFLFFLFVASLPQPSLGQTSELELSPCHLAGSLGTRRITAECGTLTVPENSAEPNGTTIELFVARVPARAKSPEADPVTFISGGPGQASTTSFADYSFAFQRLLFERDIILVDQRGTGKSNALDCEEDSSIEEYSAQAARDYAEKCLSELPGDPRYYTTSVAVQDLDRVRKALGIEQLNLYGISYGTRVALHYLKTFPEHTRTVIIDGVVAPDLTLGPGIALDAQSAMDALFQRCDEDEVCNKRFGSLNQKFSSIRSRLAQDSLMLDVPDPKSGEMDSIQFGADEFGLAMRLLSYSPETVALIPLLLDEAFTNDNFIPLAAQAMMVGRSLSDTISSGMHNAVVCSEDVPYYDDDTIPRDEIRATYLGLATVDSLVSTCSVWPKGVVDENLKDVLVSDKPVLLLSGEADPVTPPKYAEQTAASLSNHRHVVGPHQGHGMAGVGCLPRLMSDFISLGSFEEWDDSCVAETEPAPFFTSFSGPEP
ncbi:MAG: alpha/beta fold hydrolase [Pseudomonadota bacterium]